MISRLRAAGAAPIVEEGLDERLASERPKRRAVGVVGRGGIALRVWVVMAFCYLVGLQELLLSALTKVRCTPLVVRAGTNVSCTITTSSMAAETDLSITQVGEAGPITLVSSASHKYVVTFSTALAAPSGVRVGHSLLWTSSLTDVVPGPAIPGAVEVECSPPSVRIGDDVRCTVVPRDRFGNVAEVEKPEGAPQSYFAVAKAGTAGELTVHDTYVQFEPESTGRAGVSVTLDGVKAESFVQVT